MPPGRRTARRGCGLAEGGHVRFVLRRGLLSLAGVLALMLTAARGQNLDFLDRRSYLMMINEIVYSLTR